MMFPECRKCELSAVCIPIGVWELVSRIAMRCHICGDVRLFWVQQEGKIHMACVDFIEEKLQLEFHSDTCVTCWGEQNVHSW